MARVYRFDAATLVEEQSRDLAGGPYEGTFDLACDGTNVYLGPSFPEVTTLGVLPANNLAAAIINIELNHAFVVRTYLFNSFIYCMFYNLNPGPGTIIRVDTVSSFALATYSTTVYPFSGNVIINGDNFFFCTFDTLDVPQKMQVLRLKELF